MPRVNPDSLHPKVSCLLRLTNLKARGGFFLLFILYPGNPSGCLVDTSSGIFFLNSFPFICTSPFNVSLQRGEYRACPWSLAWITMSLSPFLSPHHQTTAAFLIFVKSSSKGIFSVSMIWVTQSELCCLILFFNKAVCIKAPPRVSILPSLDMYLLILPKPPKHVKYSYIMVSKRKISSFSSFLFLLLFLPYSTSRLCSGSIFCKVFRISSLFLKLYFPVLEFPRGSFL